MSGGLKLQCIALATVAMPPILVTSFHIVAAGGKAFRTVIFSTHLTLLERALAVESCLFVRPSVKRVHCDKIK